MKKLTCFIVISLLSACAPPSGPIVAIPYPPDPLEGVCSGTLTLVNNKKMSSEIDNTMSIPAILEGPFVEETVSIILPNTSFTYHHVGSVWITDGPHEILLKARTNIWFMGHGAETIVLNYSC